MSVISTQIQQWHALPSAQAKSEVILPEAEDPWLSLAEDPWIRPTLTFLYPGLWFRASKQHMQEKMPSRNARTGTLIKHMPRHSLLAEKAESVFSKISTLLLGLHSQLAGTWGHNTAIFCHFYCSIKDVFFINFKIPIFLWFFPSWWCSSPLGVLSKHCSQLVWDAVDGNSWPSALQTSGSSRMFLFPAVSLPLWYLMIQQVFNCCSS